MDSLLLSAIVTGVFGLLASLFVLLPKLSLKQQREEQLLKVYMPLARLFDFFYDGTDAEKVKEIRDILFANPHLASDDLVFECKMLESDSQNNRADFQKFRAVLFSNYHWLRKKLHLPYLRYEIKTELLPHSLYRDQQILTIMMFTPLAMSLIMWIAYLLR